MQGIIDLDCRLEIEPSLHTNAKHAFQAHCHLGGDGTPSIHYGVEIRPAHAKSLREITLI